MTGILLMSVGNSYGSAPVNTVAPVVSGTATFGQTLTTTNGTWTGAPAPTFTYQWQRGVGNISGATSSTYVLVAADVGNTVRCVVTATNAVAPGGVSANSNSTATVAAAVPGAPTIGTATATGSTTATVSYTAPASNGGGTITLYTATSSPGGITGTLATAGSGTITVTGLDTLTSYTFTVRATNSAGQGPASAASNSTTTAFPAIGQAFRGGFYAGQISTTANGVATHNLVVGPASVAQTILRWGNSTSIANTGSVIDGPTNTQNAVASGVPVQGLSFCDNLVAGGFSDWYMPASNELEVCYFNLKPTTAANDTGSGRNPNSVPSRGVTDYTAGTPARTSAANFQTGGAEAFSGIRYWSSTQTSAAEARQQRFSDGSQRIYGKANPYGVRAVRRVPV